MSVDKGERVIAGRPVELDVKVSGSARTSAPLVDEQLLLIGQEALSNAVRHGRATTVTVELDYRDGGPGILFTPDAADAARLPYVEIDHKVGSLTFDTKDYDPLIAATVPAAMQATVKAQHNKRVSVHVTLQVERYTAAIEGCTGEGLYAAHLLSAHATAPAKIVAIPPRKPGDNEDC